MAEYMTPFEKHQADKLALDKRDVQSEIGYGRLEEAWSVFEKMNRNKRAAEPSPLLMDWLTKEKRELPRAQNAEEVLAGFRKAIRKNHGEQG